MPEVTVTLTAELAQEINAMAQAYGYANGKEFVIAFLRGKIRAARMEAAEEDIRQAIDEAAQQEVEGIS